MIPLWAKTKDGNWEIFPYHLLDTYEDGKQGFTFGFDEDYRAEKTAVFMKFRHCFEPNPRDEARTKLRLGFRYYLKGKP